jgi:tetratricopeptide (TPR) repeat protein
VTRASFSGKDIGRTLILALATLLLSGCDRMITSQSVQRIKDADSATAQGEYLHAITLYEGALDGTAASANIHYKLGLLYDDKLNDPLNALHHFKRYVSLAPEGAHNKEVRQFIKRDEITLLTSLSGDSVVTRAEAVRLRNENLELRKQIEERSAKAKAAGEGNPRASTPEKKSATHEKRTYVVNKGDTLFSISRKFYKSPSRWKDILEANRSRVDSPSKLTPGITLTIP